MTLPDHCGYTGPGLHEQVIHGHQIVQSAVSSDGVPIYACRGCDWKRVGRYPDHLDRSCAVALDEEER